MHCSQHALEHAQTHLLLEQHFVLDVGQGGQCQHDEVLLVLAADPRLCAADEPLPILQVVEVAQQPPQGIHSQLQQPHRRHLCLGLVNHDEAVLEVAAAGLPGLQNFAMQVDEQTILPACLPAVLPACYGICMHATAACPYLPPAAAPAGSTRSLLLCPSRKS